ncbi:MAG TPA: glycosyltransferase family 39 protein [Isosphaeraceae bacterium]|jgi:hypothetical protein
MNAVGRPWFHGAILATVAMVAVGLNMNLHAPPRFDGAGYAVLGRSLAEGAGYREIDHPDRPRHAHFPPGYPLALAALWTAVGRSAAAAHGLSVVCTVAAVVAGWRWFRSMYAPPVAFVLGLALAVNWTWGRTGGAIQSEPLFLALETLALLAAVRAARRGGIGPGLILGAALGGCILTRHVAVALALAVGLDLALRRRWATLGAAGLVAAWVVLPWVLWLATVGRPSQAALLPRGGWAGRLAGNALFYLRRLPDALTGPFVEVATVFGRSPRMAVAATAWAASASGLLAWGGVRALRTPRRRLAGLVAAATLALLLVWPFTEAGRFLIPLVPCLLVGAIEGIGPLAARLDRRPRTWAAGVVLAVSVPYAAYALATGRAAAQARTHAAFDASCAWIARRGERPGPVLTRHPAEVSWLTGRPALAPPGDDPEAIDRLIGRYGVAYLLVDDPRYARDVANPLLRFVAARPGRVERAWSGDSVAVFAVRRPRGTASDPTH